MSRKEKHSSDITNLVKDSLNRKSVVVCQNSVCWQIAVHIKLCYGSEREDSQCIHFWQNEWVKPWQAWKWERQGKTRDKREKRISPFTSSRWKLTLFQWDICIYLDGPQKLPLHFCGNFLNPYSIVSYLYSQFHFAHVI